MRILALLPVLCLVACLAPLESSGSTTGGSPGTNTSSGTGTVSTSTSSTSTSLASTTTGSDGCGSESTKCCDEENCYCLTYCPQDCDATNVRECLDISNAIQCICVQGGSNSTTSSGAVGTASTGTTGAVSSAAASSSGAAITSGSFGAQAAASSGSNGGATTTTGSTGCTGTPMGTTTGGCVSGQQLYCCESGCSCDCGWYDPGSEPTSCTSCDAAVTNGQLCPGTPTCGLLGATCASGGDCCSSFCGDICEATPDGGQGTTTGTTGRINDGSTGNP